MDDPQGGRTVVKVQGGAVLKPLRVLLNVGPMAGLSDQELLERFMDADREVAELAFAAIVDRHGPMVLRVCRQALCNSHDAQDAFQATFFVLAQNARSVRRRMSVASWLHGVAYRVCVRTQTADARRRRREQTAANRARTIVSDWGNTSDRAEMGELIHQELERLPERFRAPIVLCDLEGIGYEEAARRLGCPVGTVKSRLARGRYRLRLQLARRGLAPSAGIVMMPAARTAVPAILRDATAHAVIRFTLHGPPAVGTVSTAAAALTEGMLKSMMLFRLKLASIVLLFIGLGTTAAVGVIAASATGEQPPAAARQTARIASGPSLPQKQQDGSVKNLIAEIAFEGNATITADKVKVKNISFAGNQFASGAQLRVKIATRKSIAELSGRYHSNLLDEDRQKLIEYYQAQGFFEAKVTPVTRPGAQPGEIDLTFMISEGSRYKVRDVIIEGNTRKKTEKLRQGLELHSGKPFMAATREADKNRMLIKYGEIGCIDTQIACEPRFTDQVGVVDLAYKIDENGPFFFSEATVRENKSSKKQ
jgi:RNA polymerase sigma factor (sigma-70 family)